jgi:hypothetical protein
MLNDPPAIDYTDKDFRALRSALLRLAQQRLPEWTDQSPADLGMLFVDLFAYVGDVALYYQDRIASELLPGTATEARSVVDLLRLIGYELSPVAPAQGDLQLMFTAPLGPQVVVVPSGAQFSTRTADSSPVAYSYRGPALSISLTSDQVRPAVDGSGAAVVLYDRLPVEQSVPVGPVVIGSSSPEPNQSFPLPERGVVRESVLLEVQEGAGWVAWERRDSLLFDIAPDGRARLSHPDARHYRLVIDADATPRVVFGTGRRPPVGTNNLRASFRVSRGAAGNAAAGTIVDALTPIPSLVAVTNPEDAAGGSDSERIDHAVRYAPLTFRSTNRAVTTSDYVALAHSTGWVAKVRARSEAWNRIDLFVAPAGDSCRPVPEALRDRLLGFYEDKRMAGTLVRVLDARCVAIDITIDVLPDERFASDAVVSNVVAAIRELLAFNRVDFGHTVFQSDIYAAAEAVPGVIAVTVRRLRRHDRPALDLDEELARHNLPGIDELPTFLREAISVDVPSEGRIEIGEFEIPEIGDLSVRVRTTPP